MTKDNAPHIERAESYSRRLFDWMIEEKYTMMKSLDVQKWADIDLELARETFDPICYKVIFDNSLADTEDLNDPITINNIWNDVVSEWPEIYYMELYVKAGIAYKFEENGEVIYGLKERHSEELTRLLTASSTK